MMKNWLLILCATCLLTATQDGLAAKRFPTTAAVEVVDVDGNPLSGIAVNLSYLTPVETIRPERQRATTDAEGRVRFEGQGYRRISIYIHEDGYYGHRENHEIIGFRDGEPYALGEIRSRIVLKEIRDPIAMVADGFFRTTIPAYDEEIGFDFMINDWVAPYGAGEDADVLMQVTGYFNSFTDRDSTLTLRFPNEGDGLIPFEMDLHSGSVLKSAHEAPIEGFNPAWEWKHSVGNDPKMNRGIRERDYVEDRGYYLRIRSRFNAEGELVSAHYGKIYGDFRFDGVWPRESGIVAEAYYVNPTANDSNVESKTGETLLQSSDRLDRPRLP